MSYDPIIDKIRTASSLVNIAGCGGLEFSALAEVWGPPKCHRVGSRVMLATGRTIAVEDVLIGTQLMGPDSTPRTVQEVHRGTGPLYRVAPRGDGLGVQYVNGEHLVAIRGSESGVLGFTRAADLSEFNEHWYKLGWQLTKPDCLTAFDSHPYFELTRLMGWWIGCGSSDGDNHWLRSFDQPSAQYTREALTKFGVHVDEYTIDGQPAFTWKAGYNDLNHDFSAWMSQLRDGYSWRIPDYIQYGSQNTRGSFLSGLVEATGSYDQQRGAYRIHDYSAGFNEAVLWMARSLGLAATSEWDYNDGHGVHAVYIYGDLGCQREGMTWLGRLFNPPSLELQPVTAIGEGEFVGFAVDGDHLYLDEHFYVTHNSGKTTFCYQTAQMFLDQYKDRARVLLLDAENSANVLRLGKVFGLHPHNHPHVRPKNRDPRVSIEPAFTYGSVATTITEYITKAKAEGAYLLFIWDSVLVTQPDRINELLDAVATAAAKERAGGSLTKEDREALESGATPTMNLKQLQPQLLKWALNQLMSRMYLQPVLGLLINQATTKFTRFGEKEDRGGGRAIRHNIHYSLKFEFVKKMTESTLFTTGTLSRLIVDKSKVIASLDDVEVFIDDNVGGRLDPNTELVYAAKKLGFLDVKNGGWYKPSQGAIDMMAAKPTKDALADLTKWRQLRDLATHAPAVATLTAAVEQYFRQAFQLLDMAYVERDEVMAEAAAK